jgi:hypothetical protein
VRLPPWCTALQLAVLLLLPCARVLLLQLLSLPDRCLAFSKMRPSWVYAAVLGQGPSSAQEAGVCIAKGGCAVWR